MRLDRLKDLMERGGWTQASLARALRVSPASIQQILNGSTKRSRSLPEIASLLEVSVGYLLGTTDDIKTNTVLAKARDGDRNLIPVRFYKPVFNIDNAQFKIEISTIFFTASWLRDIIGNVDFDEIVMQEFVGNEMAPTISTGDTIIMVNKNAFDGDPTGIWAITYNEKPLVRRIQALDGDRLQLSADNPAYPDLVVRPERVSITGKIVWQGRRWGT